MSKSLNSRAYQPAEERDHASRPDRDAAPAGEKHSLDAIAQRLADLDAGASSAAPPQELDSGQRLAATLDRVGGLIARLQTQNARPLSSPARGGHQSGESSEQAQPAVAEQRWGEDDHRREASFAFRERLAAIRAEFDLKTAAAFAGSAPPPDLPAVAADEPAPVQPTGPAEPDAPVEASEQPEAHAPRDEAPYRPEASAARPLAGTGAEIQTVLADILARQRRLDEEAQLAPQAESTSAEDAAPERDVRFDPLARLQGEIAALTTRMQAMHPERTAAEIDALRLDVAEVSRVVEPLPGQQDMLARGLEVVTERLATLTRRQIRPADFATLRDEVSAIGTSVGANLDRILAAQEQLSELPSLKARFEELSARTAANATGVEIALRVERQTQMLAEHLGSLPSAGDLSAIAEQVEAVALQIAADRAAAAPQWEELRSETAAIRSRLGEVERMRKRLEAEVQTVAARPGLAALEERLNGLAARLNEVADGSHDQATLDRIDLARFERTLADLASRFDASAQWAGTERLAGLEDTIRELAGRLDAAPPADDARISQLEGAIRDLADRIEIAGAPGAGPEAVRVLERHVDRLAEQMAGLQEVTIAASERAAMAAVQRSGTEIGSSHVEALAHHLQALNKATAASERRTHNTLEAVHETLEKVVARMAVIEDEVAGRAGVPRDAANDAQAAPGRDFQAAVLRARQKVGTDSDELLEPGSGPPSADRRAWDDDARDRDPTERDARGGGSVEFIAAARRAVQSAAAETRSGIDDVFGEPRNGAIRQMARMGRRPVVLGIAALVLMMGVIQLVTLGRSGGATEQVAQNAGKPAAARVANADRRGSAPPYSAAPVAAPTQMAAASRSPGGVPLPDPMPPGAFADPETTASIAAPSRPSSPFSAAPAGQTAPPPGADQLPRDIGGSRLRTLAAAGDPTAEYEVGVRYADGHAGIADPATAAYWLERAARQNYAPAQYRLAALFQAGGGVPRDLETARRWYERASLLGHLGAMHNLAVMYADGALGGQDYRQASAWFRRAAERGLTDSQVNLGVLLSLGLGVKQDLVEAYKWFAIAAAGGDKEAGAQRDGVEKKLDAASLARAKQAVGEFTPLSSDPAANVVTPPSGGWDTARLGTARVQ